MIVVLFGQPNCGKTTLADILVEKFSILNIDGDTLRDLFRNKDYSREGRIKNLNRASDIAHFVNSQNGSDSYIVLSLVYPYKEARDYLNNLTDDISWVYLTYEGERGRESYHVKDFDVPVDEEVLHLNTTQLTPEECIKLIQQYVDDKKRARMPIMQDT